MITTLPNVPLIATSTTVALGAGPSAQGALAIEDGWEPAGFEHVSVAFTHQVGEGLHSAIIKATKPTAADASTSVAATVGRTALPMASDSGCC